MIPAQFALEMCIAASSLEKNQYDLYFGVQGHPRSLLSVLTESACTTSYQWLIVALALSSTVSKIEQFIG